MTGDQSTCMIIFQIQFHSFVRWCCYLLCYGLRLTGGDRNTNYRLLCRCTFHSHSSVYICFYDTNMVLRKQSSCRIVLGDLA